MALVTVGDLERDHEVQAVIKMADEQLQRIGYTEHGQRHARLVAHIAHNIIDRLGYPARLADLAAIAGYLHDIGNIVNRREHGYAGAVMAMDVLRRLGMPIEEIAVVAGAVGNHDEETGEPVSEVSAAVIIADKSDVHHSRVRNPNPAKFDSHDRVNHAVQHSFVRVDQERRVITLEVTVEDNMCRPADYFEIFMSRVQFIRRAAAFLNCEFELVMNNNRLL